jgi:hypothetical protein
LCNAAPRNFVYANVKRLLALVLLLAPLGAAAQEVQSTTVVVPIVGNIAGINGVRWVTSVELRNDALAPVEVWMLLPTTAEAQAFNRTLGPGETVSMPDVIAQAFGTTTALSPLKVITTGRRSVTIKASVYPIREGQVLSAEPIAVDYRGLFYPVRSLPGLAFSDDFRTNIGLANLSDDKDATFVLALQRLPGRNVAVTRLTLPPDTLTHTSIQSLFPLITNGTDFTVVVETASAETFIYASVIDNQTSAARFIQANVGLPVEAMK